MAHQLHLFPPLAAYPALPSPQTPAPHSPAPHMAFDSPQDMFNYTATAMDSPGATFDLGSPFIDDILLEDILRGQ